MQVRKSLRIFGVMYGVAFGVALEPFRMRLHRVFPVQVGTHARNHMESALLGGGAAIAEEIAVAQEFAFPMEGHFGLIESQDSGDAHQSGIHFQAGPVIGPFLNVQHDRIVLGHV